MWHTIKKSKTKQKNVTNAGIGSSQQIDDMYASTDA